MRVLLTGHLGYIGCVMTPMLQRAGHEVVGVDTDLYGRCVFDRGGALPDVPNLRKDVRDLERKDLEGFDAVIHLAGLSNDPLGDLDPELTFDINHRATVRLAELARDAGVRRFIFSSSCSNYGAAGEDVIDESGALNPVTPYGVSKVRAEQDVAPMASETFTPIFPRSATAYGVSAKIRFDLVLNNLMAHAVATGLVYLKSDGTPWRPIVHIEDISRAFAALLEAPAEEVSGKAFNVGSTDENYQMRELARIVAQTAPGARVEYAPDAGPDKRCYRVNCDRLVRAFPEAAPRWSARQGARELYEAFSGAGLSREDFEGPRFKRVAHIQSLLASGKLDSSLRWRDSA